MPSLSANKSVFVKHECPWPKTAIFGKKVKIKVIDLSVIY